MKKPCVDSIEFAYIEYQVIETKDTTWPEVEGKAFCEAYKKDNNIKT